MSRRTVVDWILPLAGLALLTILFRATDWDLALAGRFYAEGSGWALVHAEPWRSLYRYGPNPSVAIGVLSLLVLLAGIRSASLRRHRRTSLFLLLALLVGPGLVVNVVVRDHWGRPRPRDVVPFGGTEEFWKVLERRPGGTGHSFPSGHASSAFYLGAPFFLFRGRRQGRAAAFLVLGIGYGIVMGIARMGQGAHFASDIVWAGAFTYFTALILARLTGVDSAARRLEERASRT
jgi:membrane-associated PAP2 superfamily phosphatase